MKKICIPPALLLVAGSLLLGHCTFTRDDLFRIATAQPDIFVIPNSTGAFSFGTVDVYNSVSQVFMIENTGGRDLEISKLYTSAPSGAGNEFTIDSRDTGSLLRPGETTFFSVVFKPTGTDPVSVTLLIESNDPDEGLYQLVLNGEGVWGTGSPPQIIVEEDGVPIPGDGSYLYDFKDVFLGTASTKMFTIRNAPSAGYPLAVQDIAFIDGDVDQFNRIAPAVPAGLKTNETVTFHVVFDPTVDGDYESRVEIKSDDPSNGSFVFTVRGMGITAPAIRVYHGSVEIPYGAAVNFGSVPNNTTGTEELFVVNTGNIALNVANIQVFDANTPPVFIYGGPTAVQIPPGEKKSVTFTFVPDFATGYFQAGVEIQSDDPKQPVYRFNLEGDALPTPVPDINVTNDESGAQVPSGSEGYDFTTLSLGSSATVRFGIENRGTENLSISNIGLSGTDASQFSLGSLSSDDIPPGGKATFEATYAPGVNGSHTATVIIESNDPDTAEENPYLVGLKGRGSEKNVPDIEVSVDGKKYDNGSAYYFSTLFSPVFYGNSVTRSFTVKNKGKALLVISGILLVGDDGEDFSFKAATPVNLPAGATFSFTVTFTPTVNPLLIAKKRTTRLQIKSSDPDENPYKIDLIGYVL
jgi:hypothetical protein